jgi:hypothetical protein
MIEQNGFISSFRLHPSAVRFLALLFIISSGAHSIFAQDATPRGEEIRSGSLSGRVMTGDGQGMPNVIVVLFAVGGAPGAYRQATTEPDGTFRIEDIAPGVYRVSPQAPSYVLADASLRAAPSAPVYARAGDTLALTMIPGGVITGRVMNAAGESLVGINVRALRVRSDTDESPEDSFMRWQLTTMTDDRGIYRLYGLAPGAYVVSAGGINEFVYEINPFLGETLTYHPSSSRDRAAVINVRSGEEATGIDIRYRGEHGHTIRGQIARGGDSSMMGISVELKHAASDTTEATVYIYNRNSNDFLFDGIPDGEYIITARTIGIASDDYTTAPVRVSVRGRDVTGVQLALAPAAWIRGRIRLERFDQATDAEACAERGQNRLEEIIVTARRTDRATGERTGAPMTSAPNATGEFTLRNPRAGRYRLSFALPPNDSWYIRSITLPRRAPGNAETGATNNTASDEVSVAQNERVTGIDVTVAEGAAQIHGRIVPTMESQPLHNRLRVYLVPTETERADDYLRYAEAAVNEEGRFMLRRIAPGRYRIFARSVSENESNERRADPAFRAQLRREAEATNAVIELGLCERVADYIVRYTVPTSAR